MADLKQYVPILKCKIGDMWALRFLKSSSKKHVFPVIELVPPSEKKTVEEQVLSAVKDIKKSWQNRPFYIDGIWLSDYETKSLKTQPLNIFFNAARKENLRAIPVTGLRRSSEYQNTIKHIVKKDKKSVLLRVSQEDDLDVQKRGVRQLLQFLEVTKNDSHLMLDFGHIASLQTKLLARNIESSIDSLPDLRSWNRLSVSVGAFPENLANLDKGDWNRIARKDWQSWNELVTNLSPKRQPLYSDFTIGAPSLPYSGRANITVNLRYSTEKEYFVWKGYWTKTHGYDQVYKMCSDLLGKKEYAGKTFSQGDTEISEKATIQDGPGNPASWRKWATNHYIELVVNQIANHPAL